MQRSLGFFFIFLAAVLWALIGPLGRIAMSEGLSPLEVAFWRAFFGAAFFWLHAFPQRLYHVPARAVFAFALFGVVGIAWLFFAYLVAVEQAGVGLAAILLYTAPAWVAFLSRMIFGEALSGRKLLALALAMAGAALACASGGGLPQGASMLGIGAGLLSGFCYSLHYIFSRHYLRDFSSVSLYCWCLPAGALCLLPFVGFASKTPLAWLALLLMGLLSTYGAYWAYCEAIKRLPPTLVAISATLEPVLAGLMAWGVWGELLTGTGWLGAGFVLAAVLLVVGTRDSASEEPAMSTGIRGKDLEASCKRVLRGS